MSSDGDDLAMICTPSRCITSGHSIVSKTTFVSHICARARLVALRIGA
jgi:hypothetical protein